MERLTERLGNKVINVKYASQHETAIHRIRRITGYLVGSLERWGNAKRAEERDRVKHNVGNGKSSKTA